MPSIFEGYRFILMSDDGGSSGHPFRSNRTLRRHPRPARPGTVGGRPFPSANRRHASLLEEAAALWESLAQNHAFLDREQARLAINGVRLTPDPNETYEFIAG